MTHIKSLSIPQTCHQSWQQMTTVNEGRHCEHCCKTVTDFTLMTNDEIINYLSAKNNICGRFEHQQLNYINRHLYIEDLSASGRWKRILLIAGMITTINSLKVSGQNKAAIVKTPDASQACPTTSSKNYMLGKVLQTDSTSKNKHNTINEVVIKGKVTDKSDRSTIPGVTIKVKGTNTITQTDVSGNFTIHVQDQYQVLQVSYVGYILQEIPLNGDVTKLYDIQMQENTSMLGEVVIVKQSLLKRMSLPKRIWRKIKRVL
jgi:hypothetical protein